MNKLSTRDFIREILKGEYSSQNIKNILLDLLEDNNFKNLSKIEEKSKNVFVFSGHIELSFTDNTEADLFLKTVKYLNKSGKDKLSLINSSIIDMDYVLKEDGRTVQIKTRESQYVNSIEQGIKEVRNMYSDVVSRTIKSLANIGLLTNEQEKSETYRNLLLNSGVNLIKEGEENNDNLYKKLSKVFAINSQEFLEKMKKMVSRAENSHKLNGQQAAEIEHWLKKVNLEGLMSEPKLDLLDLLKKQKISQSKVIDSEQLGILDTFKKSISSLFGFEEPKKIDKIKKEEPFIPVRINRTTYA